MSMLCRRVVARSSAQRRLASTAVQNALSKQPNDVVITVAHRTAVGRAKKGQLKDTTVDEMLSTLFKATLDKSGIDAARIDDICVGTCHPPSPLYISRSAAMSAGIPASVPISTVNRLCSSGLMAMRTIAHDIKSGAINIGIAAGVESMSLHPRPTPELAPSVATNDQANDCVQPMGWTSEMVAETYNVSREKQDAYALISHSRAEKALKAGVFAEEIVPLRVGEALATVDDTIRPGVTAESLAKLKPVFPDWGHSSTTAGNASGVSDGAGMVLMMRRSVAEQAGLRILAKWVGSAIVGVEPRYMGIGPVAAIPKVLQATGLTKEEVDLWEINEAFASQFAYCVEELGISMDKINPNGGSIAIGHPLGMTGVRLAVTGLAELRRQDKRIMCESMCIGSGMGAAAILVNEA